MPHPDLSDLRRAVDAAIASSDFTGAVAALHPVARALAAELGAGFRELVSRIPAEHWERDAIIASAMGVSFRAAGSAHASSAIGYFRAAEAVLAGTDRSGDPARVAAWLGHAAALRSLGRLDSALEYVTRARELDGPGGVLSVPVRVELGARTALEHGMLELHLGRTESARRHLRFALGLASESLTRAEHIECLGAMALVEYIESDFAAADHLAAEARAFAAGTSLENSGYSAAGTVAESMVAIDRHDLDAAAALEPRMIATVTGTEFEPFGHIVSGYLRLASRRLAEGLDHLHRARQAYRSWAPPGVGLSVAELLRAGILVFLDHGDEAWEILRELPPYEQHLLCPGRVVAQLRLGHGDLTGAAQALVECELLGEEHSPRTLVEVRLLRAAIEFERGDLGLSDSMMDRALVTMARTGTRAPLRIVPPGSLAGLTARALTRPQGAEASRILEQIAEATEGSDRLIEALSARELLVLAEVEKGSTVGAIAGALFLSPNTVKTHLRRLYRKLGVTTRSEAIRKAKSLGLGRQITP